MNKLIIWSIWSLVLVFFSQTYMVASTESPVEPLKVGFVDVGPVNEWGWNYRQNLGRLYVEKALKGKVETIYAEQVPENAEAERVMEKMVAQGCKLIFASSYGYLEPLLRVSRRHPEVTFMQLSRFAKEKNVGTYFGYDGEAFYLAGVTAGRITKTNKIGFVASHPVPSILWAINGFTLGLHSVNPKAKVSIVWTNKWVDPVTEVEAAKSLIETGIDILAFDQSDSLPIVKTAESKGIKVCGCYADVHQFAPKQWVTGPNFNWGPFFTKVCESVIDHTWKSNVYIGDLASGTMELSPFGPSVPDSVRKEVLELKEKIQTGKLTVFAGPLTDANGKVRLKIGEKPDIQWLSKMNFFVQGLGGSPPKE